MIWNENCLPITEVPKILPRRRGKKIAHSTIWRWIAKGVRGVRLEAWRLGGTYYTSPQALEHFAKALAALEPADRVVLPARANGVPLTRYAARRKREIASAKAELARAGI